MRLVFFVLITLVILGIECARAECWVVGRDNRGREFFECDDSIPQLPVCGSEYDVGDRCMVIRNPRQRVQDPRRAKPPPVVAQDSKSLSSPTGKTPFNAGGSWPNRAKEYSQGKK
jgi:hypothetical protein